MENISTWQHIEFWQHEMPWGRLGLYLFLTTFVLGNLATWLRFRKGWRDGDTRKVGHIGHMLVATALLVFLPTRTLIPVVVVGTFAVAFIYATALKSSVSWLHGIVAASLRDGDNEKGGFFFILALIAGNIALVIAVFVFPIDYVRVAYFTVGIGDGLAEVIGIRFGRKNGYRVPDPIWKGSNLKSVAGSFAMFSCSFLIVLIFYAMHGRLPLVAVAKSSVYALSATAFEAISPKGLDNMVLFFVMPLVLEILGSAA